jgi:hypothetical protein
MTTITCFDDARTGVPHIGIGYHWVDPDETLDRDIRDGTFYLSDDLYEWASPWLSGMHAYKIKYQVTNPRVWHRSRDNYELQEHNYLKVHKEVDALIYTPHNDIYGRSHRQLLLLEPKTQILEISPITLKDLTDNVRLQTDAGADYHDQFLPLFANLKGTEEQPEEFEVYALGPTGRLVKHHLKDTLPEGQSAADHFRMSAARLNMLSDRFEQMAAGKVVPYLELANIRKSTFGPFFTDSVTPPTRPSDKVQLGPPDHLDCDIDEERLCRKAILSRIAADNQLERINGEVSLTYSGDETFRRATKHPIQRVQVSEDGIYRFVPNAIVKHMVEYGPWTLNDLRAAGDDNDYAQLAQQIGYSVSGWEDLSVVKRRHSAAAYVEQELAIRDLESATEVNLDRVREVPPIPGIVQEVMVTSTLTFVPEVLPILLYNMVHVDRLAFHVSVDVDETTLELTFNDDLAIAGEVYTTIMAGVEVEVTSEGKLTFNDGEHALLTLTIDVDRLGNRLRQNAISLPAHTTVGISTLFNAGLLTKTAKWRPDTLYQLCETVWRFIAIRSQVLILLEQPTCDLNEDVKTSIRVSLWASGVDPESPENIEGFTALQDLIKRKPKPTSVNGIVLLAMYNISRSQLGLENGELFIDSDNLKYVGNLDLLTQHIVR